MYCPFCNSEDTRVIDSRLANEGDSVRRRRACAACGERFTTFERAEISLPRVVKRDGTRVPFDEAKLRAGMLRALEKRQVESDRVEQALARIRRGLMGAAEREINSRAIGEQVMQALRELDEVAYVRFASVYHRFERAEDFQDTVAAIQNEPTPEARRNQLSLLAPLLDVTETTHAADTTAAASIAGTPASKRRRAREAQR